MADKDLLGTTWHDSAWIPVLNPSNVMDYFSERSNPFYERTCNNEVVKMQRFGMDQLNAMTGVEYVLLHVQDPILYIVRKQYRQSPSQASPLADYYIVAGKVYQAPDMAAIVNSRLMNTISNLESAFEEARSYSRYHPSKGYWWEFKDDPSKDEREEKEKAMQKKRKKEEPSWWFQRQRVDLLLAELANKYPPKVVSNQQQTPAPPQASAQQQVLVPLHQPQSTTLQQPASGRTGTQGDKADDAVKVEVKVESRHPDMSKNINDKKPVTRLR